MDLKKLLKFSKKKKIKNKIYIKDINKYFNDDVLVGRYLFFKKIFFLKINDISDFHWYGININKDNLFINSKTIVHHNFGVGDNIKDIINMILFFNNEKKYNYINYGNNIDTISYFPMDKKYLIDDKENYWNSKLRVVIKFGKFIKKNIPLIKEKYVEEIVNLYKSNMDKFGIEGLKLVKGEDIRYYYNENHYSKGNNSLHKSCMRHVSKQHKLDIYVRNPEVCSLLVKLDFNGKVMARALVWELEDGSKYIDRIYFANGYEKKIYENFGIKYNYIMYPARLKMSVKLKWVGGMNNSKYPYADTFTYLNFNKNTLSNIISYHEKHIKLNNFNV